MIDGPGAVAPSMTKGHTISIRPADAHVEVRIGGVLVADTERPLLLDETGLPTRYYVPVADVRTELFRETSFHTTCPFKGEASYWTAEIDGASHDGVVWSYLDPIEGAEDITGLWSFYPDRAEILVDGARI
jgi:uncharacterized protein (DUF427 family)